MQRTRTIARRAAALTAIALALALLPACHAAPPLAPALQGELDRALLDYESGRIDSARSALESLARREVPAALHNLAVMHLRGQMPQSSPASAERLLTRAAEAGFVTAQLLLGQLYEGETLGRRDLVLAHRWYELAAHAGSVEGQVALATAYYLGRGKPKDPARAVHWYREAAKAGDVGAQYLLASMYEQGDGVALDLRLARYWYDIAARNGDEAAPGKLKEIDARLAARPG
ncbi:MAG: tetratricopeptide repeat protein [Rubrivivax sp.]|nr:tetratricopeptide repeat protein [Rubrivivax sp.]